MWIRILQLIYCLIYWYQRRMYIYSIYSSSCNFTKTKSFHQQIIATVTHFEFIVEVYIQKVSKVEITTDVWISITIYVYSFRNIYLIIKQNPFILSSRQLHLHLSTDTLCKTIYVGYKSFFCIATLHPQTQHLIISDYVKWMQFFAITD